MKRRNQPRRVGFIPEALYFRPVGVESAQVEELTLGRDELEAIRLKDLLGLSQGDAALEMGISQPTFHRLVLTARQRIADAFVNGKAVRIEGGNIDAAEAPSQPCHWRRRWGCKAGTAGKNGSKPVAPRSRAGGIVLVAVTSIDGNLDGQVDERFGRSRKIVLYDRLNRTFEVFDNRAAMNSPQAAGIQTAHRLAETPVQAVISGHLGPYAYAILQAAGIEAYSATGTTVRGALGSLEDGTLTRLTGPDVEAHWGKGV